MDLVVEKHRGHLASNHPNQLCDGTKYTNYISSYGSKMDPSSDWVIFKQRRRRMFLPTKLVI